MRQYEERKKEIEKLQEQLDEADGEKDMKKKQLELKLNKVSFRSCLSSMRTNFFPHINV